MNIFPHTKKQWVIVCIVFAAVVLLAAAVFLYQAVWHAGFAATGDSFFDSPFIRDKKVLVLVAHPDDEINLAFGVIDAFTQAGSDVTIAFATNGDKQTPGAVRLAEAIRADARMGVDKDHIIALGYGDYVVPPYCMSDLNQVRQSEAGFTQTYGGSGIPDYHTCCFGKAAQYTGANYEADIGHLIRNLRPDIIFTADTDYHIDHVSLSQSFDRVMGKLLRDEPGYKPTIFKGYCYEYAWYANDDFYNFLMLKSAVAQWNRAGYNTAFPWEERVRFPLPAEYLGYTKRSSKLYKVLGEYKSQEGLSRAGRMLNGDKLFWERRADVLWADVTATSGNAVLLQDFLLGDTMEQPLANCWIPDPEDRQPEIQFTWPAPQPIAELVFYDAPPDAGDIRRVQITDDTGYQVIYTLPRGDGMPCRLAWDGSPTRRLTIRILESEGDTIGFSEIEILPRREQETQWIHLLDPDMNFLYEYPCPADQPFTLLLYGYPAAPGQATVTIAKESSTDVVAEIAYDGYSFSIPALPAGRYRALVSGDGCTAEAVLRVGDSMLLQRVYRFAERMLSKVFTD